MNLDKCVGMDLQYSEWVKLKSHIELLIYSGLISTQSLADLWLDGNNVYKINTNKYSIKPQNNVHYLLDNYKCTVS